jgi:hypothetical protein
MKFTNQKQTWIAKNAQGVEVMRREIEGWDADDKTENDADFGIDAQDKLFETFEADPDNCEVEYSVPQTVNNNTLYHEEYYEITCGGQLVGEVVYIREQDIDEE